MYSKQFILDTLSGEASIFQDEIKQRLGKIKELLADKELDLEYRWNIYTDLCKEGILQEIDCYGDGFITVLNKNMTQYDHLGTERHETVNYIDMYERITENMSDPYYDVWESVTQEKLDEWREAVLASGQKGFTYDW